MASKLEKALRIIKRADEVLDAIDHTIDLPRLITTSNAQGNLARIVREAVNTAARLGDNSPSDTARVPPSKGATRKQVKRVPKQRRLK